MPIYNYRCTACEATFEKLMGMKDPTPVCPSCGSPEVSRQLSRVATTGKAEAIFASARKQAAREGHFSNYSKSERPKLKP